MPPPQLEYYYPSSLGTTTLPAWVLLPFQLKYNYPLRLLPFQLEYNYPLSSLNSSSERRNRSCTRFSSILFAEPSLFYILLGLRPDGTITLGRCHPSSFCDFLEKLVVGDGVKTLGLYLRATCRSVVLLIFGSVCFRSYIIVYTDSLILLR